MRNFKLLFLVIIAALASCSKSAKEEAKQPEIDTIPVLVSQIQKDSRLYTAECHIHKIVTQNDVKKINGSFLNKKFSVDLPFSSRQVAIPMDATVKAYVDMGKVTEENIHRNGKKIQIVLPDPQLVVTSTKIDHKDMSSYVALLRDKYTDKELTAIERQGRDAMMADIPQLRIIEQSRASAARIIIPMCTALGYEEKNVTVTFRKQEYTLDEIKQMTQHEGR
ncbi:MAG: DUF4230 domain-containing protein [Prevotella sp.]|nr:DUF4230 domain-containing protein [Bacteroidales bacterium]MDY4229484.1 DUF4230 domain-containing protein [Prevotella sp.]